MVKTWGQQILRIRIVFSPRSFFAEILDITISTTFSVDVRGLSLALPLRHSRALDCKSLTTNNELLQGQASKNGKVPKKGRKVSSGIQPPSQSSMY